MKGYLSEGSPSILFGFDSMKLKLKTRIISALKYAEYSKSSTVSNFGITLTG